jgi:hypothetical protein
MVNKHGMAAIVAIGGWLLLVIGGLMTCLEPHRNYGELAIAGAILIAGERIMSVCSLRQ